MSFGNLPDRLYYIVKLHKAYLGMQSEGLLIWQPLADCLYFFVETYVVDTLRARLIDAVQRSVRSMCFDLRTDWHYCRIVNNLSMP